MFNKLPIGLAALSLFAADGSIHLKGVSAIKIEKHHHKKHTNKSWPNNSEPPRPDENAKAPTVDIPNSFQGPFVRHSNAQTQDESDKHNWNPINVIAGPFGPTHNAQQETWPNDSEPPRPDQNAKAPTVDIPNGWQGPFVKTSNSQQQAWPYTSEPGKMENPAEGKSIDVPNGWQGPFSKTSQVQKSGKWPNPEYEGSNEPHPNYPTGPWVTADKLEPRLYMGKANKWGQEIDGEWTSHPNFPVGPYGDAHEKEGQGLSQRKPHSKSHKKHKKSHKSKAHKKEIKDEENASDPNCNSADGCLTDTVDPYTRKKDPFNKGLKVPDLGMDHDIKDTQTHIADTEKKLKHKLKMPKDEKKVQLESDPICASADCPDVHLSADFAEAKHPINYFVPNFGVDSDIVGTQESEASASAATGETWTPAWDPKAEKFIVPHEDAEFKLLQTGEKQSSDPNFNSHTGYMVNHSAEETKAQKAAPAYDFDPKLDADILHTHEHLGDAESKLGKLSVEKVQLQGEVDTLEQEFNAITDEAEKSQQQKQQVLAQRVTPESSAAKYKATLAQMKSNWGTK